MYTGLTTGTGAAINIEMGFTPNYVRVCNITDSIILEWSNTMGAGKGIKHNATGVVAAVSSNGITASTSSDTFRGITLGTDGVNTTGDQLSVIAFR
jgi:hypothetical protein